MHGNKPLAIGPRHLADGLRRAQVWPRFSFMAQLPQCQHNGFRQLRLIRQHIWPPLMVNPRSGDGGGQRHFQIDMIHDRLHHLAA